MTDERITDDPVIRAHLARVFRRGLDRHRARVAAGELEPPEIAAERAEITVMLAAHRARRAADATGGSMVMTLGPIWFDLFGSVLLFVAIWSMIAERGRKAVHDGRYDGVRVTVLVLGAASNWITHDTVWAALCALFAVWNLGIGWAEWRQYMISREVGR